MLFFIFFVIVKSCFCSKCLREKDKKKEEKKTKKKKKTKRYISDHRK